jgi:hypothetical protein
MPASLPPLAAEDHVCDVCSIAYEQTRIDHATSVIAGLPEAVRDAVGAIPAELRRVRPSPGVWSVSEYVCHLRDVYVAFTIRLHRVRTEDEPALEPMFNDLRARRFRYNECDLIATRLPGEQRTARWLVRQAMHEGVHHLRDIRRFGSELVVP